MLKCLRLLGIRLVALPLWCMSSARHCSGVQSFGRPWVCDRAQADSLWCPSLRAVHRQCSQRWSPTNRARSPVGSPRSGSAYVGRLTPEVTTGSSDARARPDILGDGSRHKELAYGIWACGVYCDIDRVVDANVEASWICGLWCGIAERLLVERLAQGPLTESQAQHLRSLASKAAASAPYVREAADSFIAVLDCA